VKQGGATARALGEQKFPRLGGENTRSLDQRIDDARMQSERSCVRKVIDDIALVVYLHIPEMTLFAHLVSSVILLYSRVDVICSLIELLIFLVAVGEQGLFFGFHPRENVGLLYTQLHKMTEIFFFISDRLSRVIGIFLPISSVVPKCWFWMRVVFDFYYSGLMNKALSLCNGSYIIVNCLFPKFFGPHKFYRVVLNETQNIEVFPSQDHFMPLVWKDLYKEKDLQAMLDELRGKLFDSLNSLKKTEDMAARGPRVEAVNQLFQWDRFTNLRDAGLKDMELKLIVGTILEKPQKLSRLLAPDMQILQDTCLHRQALELRWIFQEWYEEKLGEGISESDDSQNLRCKLRRQFLSMLQQYRDDLASSVRQTVMDMAFSWVRVDAPALRDNLVANYYFYVSWQVIYGTYLGLSNAQIIEDQMQESYCHALFLLKWLAKLHIFWLEGKVLMTRYFQTWEEHLVEVICDSYDDRIAQGDVWAYLVDGNLLDDPEGQLLATTDLENAAMQLLREHMQILLLKLGLLKTSAELDALGEGKAPILVLNERPLF